MILRREKLTHDKEGQTRGKHSLLKRPQLSVMTAARSANRTEHMYGDGNRTPNNWDSNSERSAYLAHVELNRTLQQYLAKTLMHVYIELYKPSEFWNWVKINCRAAN